MTELQMVTDIELAHKILGRLCQQKDYNLKMSVPAQQNDEDLILFRVINYAQDAALQSQLTPQITTNEAAIRSILEGIDKDEEEDPKGWWYTSSGAEFGKEKLNEILALFSQVKAETVDLETLKRVHPIRDRANGVYSSASYEVDGYNRAIDEIKSKYGDLYTIERE